MEENLEDCYTLTYEDSKPRTCPNQKGAGITTRFSLRRFLFGRNILVFFIAVIAAILAFPVGGIPLSIFAYMTGRLFIFGFFVYYYVLKAHII